GGVSIGSLKEYVYLGDRVVAVQTCPVTTYDLKSQWSDSENPNCAWSYREGSNPLRFVASWQAGIFTTPQPAWARSASGNTFIPVWFRSNGTETFTHDWQAGDIIVHTTDPVSGAGGGFANVAWKSPFSGTVNVTGAVWLARDIGRSNNWTLYL